MRKGVNKMVHKENDETLESLLEYCKSEDRVCPMPLKWNELFRLLKNKKQKSNGGWKPAVPLILAAWYDTPGIMKMIRLKEHLEWAKKENQMEEVSLFLRSLKEEDWLHISD